MENLNGCYDPIPAPVIVVSASGTISDMNPLAQSLFGARSTGRLYAAVLRQPELITRIDMVLRGEQGGPVRYLTDEANREVVYEAHVSPGPTGSVIICLIDVTHKEEAGQMRSDFVANVSHELRTPLTALAGFIETLRGPARDDADARARFLDIMEREASRMNRLVSDLLSLSRVEDMERMRPVEPQPIDELLNLSLSTLRAQIEAQDVEIEQIVDEAAPETIPGDRDQLMQVFTNLIENAVKYGKRGGRVRIAVERHENRPGVRGPAVCIVVDDQGDGIPPHHIARLTERFYRVDGHRSREMGGTGLGLAIVKHIVSRHRGRLRIESTLGQGSRFTICLPEQI